MGNEWCQECGGQGTSEGCVGCGRVAYVEEADLDALRARVNALEERVRKLEVPVHVPFSPFNKWIEGHPEFRREHARHAVAFHEGRNEVIAVAEDLVDVIRQMTPEQRADPKVIFCVVPW